MNAKQVVSAVFVAFAATCAMAVEATQFELEPSTRTRAEVKAEMARAEKDGAVLVGGEATQFVDSAVAAAPRSRDEVRAEAVMANRDHFFNDLYVGG